MGWNDDEIKGKVLHKLSRLGKFEHSHTSIDNLPKGFPVDMRVKFKDMVKELKKEGILLSKPTSYGEEVSINSSMKERIIYYINKFFILYSGIKDNVNILELYYTTVFAV